MSESSFEIKPLNGLSSQEMYQKPKKQMVYESGKTQGSWSTEEHQKYIIFIQHNINDKKRKMHKKTSKLFKLMSKFIQTRNLLQCRSHHQKLELKYRSIRIMIEKEKKKFNQNFYQQLYLQSFNQINKIYQNQFGGKQPYFTSQIHLEAHIKEKQQPQNQKIAENILIPEKTINNFPFVLVQPLPFIPTQNTSFYLFPSLSLSENLNPNKF